MDIITCVGRAESRWSKGWIHLSLVPHPCTPPPCNKTVIYSAGFWVTIERLTPDFLGVTGEMFDGFRGNQAEWGVEAPLMFKRRGLYYILFGPFCCFCYQVFCAFERSVRTLTPTMHIHDTTQRPSRTMSGLHDPYP